jgi:hypothetical protein
MQIYLALALTRPGAGPPARGKGLEKSYKVTMLPPLRVSRETAPIRCPHSHCWNQPEVFRIHCGTLPLPLNQLRQKKKVKSGREEKGVTLYSKTPTEVYRLRQRSFIACRLLYSYS